MPQDGYSLAKIGFDTAENELRQVCCMFITREPAIQNPLQPTPPGEPALVGRGGFGAVLRVGSVPVAVKVVPSALALLIWAPLAVYRY